MGQLGHANLGTTSIYLQGSTPKRSGCARVARADDVRQRWAAALIRRQPAVRAGAPRPRHSCSPLAKRAPPRLTLRRSRLVLRRRLVLVAANAAKLAVAMPALALGNVPDM